MQKYLTIILSIMNTILVGAISLIVVIGKNRKIKEKERLVEEIEKKSEVEREILQLSDSLKKGENHDSHSKW